nr:MAG TPA: hypothetical protein [Caudoviricetes sp.]
MGDKKSDWKYIESKTLKQTIAYDMNSGWVFCRDGTKYSPNEVKLLGENELPIEVHLLKKVFNGEIINAADERSK